MGVHVCVRVCMHVCDCGMYVCVYVHMCMRFLSHLSHMDNVCHHSNSLSCGPVRNQWIQPTFHMKNINKL